MEALIEKKGLPSEPVEWSRRIGEDNNLSTASRHLPPHSEKDGKRKNVYGSRRALYVGKVTSGENLNWMKRRYRLGYQPKMRVNDGSAPKSADKVEVMQDGVRLEIYGRGNTIRIDGKLAMHVSRRFIVIKKEMELIVPAWNDLRIKRMSERPTSWHLARLVLDYQRRAMSPEGLAGDGKRLFTRICSFIDYTRLCAAQLESVAIYHEGRVLSKGTRPKLLINWAEELELPFNLVEQLNIVEEGEDFGGMFYFGEDGRIVDLVNVHNIDLRDGDQAEDPTSVNE